MMAASQFTLLHGLRAAIAIGWSDFVLKYRGSALGYLWSLIGPLVKFAVILYVFGPYVNASIPQYPLYLFLGLILWEHFAATTSGCMNMLLDKEPIIQRMNFPHIVLILAVGWTNFIIFLTHLVIYIAAALIMNVQLTIGVLYIVLIALQMTLFSLGIGMMLAAFCLKYRDIGHLWGVALQILFWLTPIMYPHRTMAVATGITNRINALGADGYLWGLLNLFIHYQPLSILMNDLRRAFLYPLTTGVPGFAHATGATLVTLLIFLVGAWIFRRRSPYFAQEY